MIQISGGKSALWWEQKRQMSGGKSDKLGGGKSDKGKWYIASPIHETFQRVLRHSANYRIDLKVVVSFKVVNFRDLMSKI